VTPDGPVPAGSTPTRVDHVVFCVLHEHLAEAADLWRDLGLTFAEFDLADVGLSVLIDWAAGIELIAPVPGAGEVAEAYTSFLATRGEGFFSVVMAVDEVEGPAAVARRYGAHVAYQQRRRHGDLDIDEVQLTPIHGMPITFLATTTET
jgi:4-hydroxyphenylpyruvate dioxygenase-like putative hemolysin